MTEEKPIVFVVDDDEAVRDSLRWLIASIDLAVHTSASAAEFLDSYDDGQPGCMIVDVRMPGMSGLELQRQLSDRGINLPVIIITGFSTEASAIEAANLGVSGYLTKPFKVPKVLSVVARALGE